MCKYFFIFNCNYDSSKIILKEREGKTTKQNNNWFNETSTQNEYYYYVDGGFIINVKDRGEIEWNIEKLKGI